MLFMVEYLKTTPYCTNDHRQTIMKIERDFLNRYFIPFLLNVGYLKDIVQFGEQPIQTRTINISMVS